MIGTTEEFQEAVRKPHKHVALVEVVRDDAVIRTLEIHTGSVTADRSGRILRRFACTVADPDGELTPAGIRDLLAPFGVILRLYRGVVIQTINEIVDIDETQAQWNEGTRSGTAGDSNGDLVLSNL